MSDDKQDECPECGEPLDGAEFCDFCSARAGEHEERAFGPRDPTPEEDRWAAQSDLLEMYKNEF